MDVDQYPGETERPALFIELATAAGQHPQMAAIGAQHTVFSVVRFAGTYRIFDALLHPGAVIGVNVRFGNVLRQVGQVLIRREGKGPGKSVVRRQHVVSHVPDKRAKQCPGVKGQSNPFVVGTIGIFGGLAQTFGQYQFGGLHHHCHHA